MNKLPWFTHDHDARNDEFIQRAEDKFGHFGYSAFFKILEIIHEHGNGGILTMSKSRVCQNLRSRWPQVRLYLDFCRTSGKLEFNLSGDEVQLQNKKFIERQRKMKSNAPAMLRQCSGNAPLEREGEEEREGDKKPPLPPTGGVDAETPEFKRFWAAYPRKDAKRNALKAFRKLSPDEALLGTILAAIERKKTSPQWAREDGQYIPQPARFINGALWEDQGVIAPPQTNGIQSMKDYADEVGI